MTHRAHIHTDSVKCHQRSRKLAKMIKSHRHRCWGRTQGWKIDILEKILFKLHLKKKHLLKKRQRCSLGCGASKSVSTFKSVVIQ